MADLILNISAPGGLWMIIINWINSGVFNFAWTIILFTLLIKVVLSPFDFLIKYSTKKTTLIQQKCAPQIAKLQKKYANNQQQFSVLQQNIYKKEGLNMMSSCLIMLVNLIVTILIFFSIYTTLREASAYYAIKQYQELNTAYTNAYEKVLEDRNIGYNSSADYSENEAMKAEIATAKQDESVKTAVMEKWNEVKDSWLWIKNIWVLDGHTDPLPTYSDLTKLANNAGGLFNSGVKDSYVEYVKGIKESDYNEVRSTISSSLNGWNGYYILVVLAGGVTFLSSWVNERSNSLKRKKEPKQRTNQFIKSSAPAQNNNQTAQTSTAMKVMKFALPAVMIIFVLTSSSAFGIYIVAQSLIGIGMSYLINLIVDKLTHKKQLEVIEYLDKIER
ncbi:MAG: YidC/Oxa1 family membrane protein insertase [bacterium]|nr:YidC/Oxa1 family membrane protein insertase [bacterium]